MMNLFLGLCKGDRALPKTLVQLGYQEFALEMKFQNADGETVVPELIISSHKVHHALLFEWKAGRNTEADQLKRYSRISTADLRQRAFMPTDRCETHDVTLICLQENRESFVIGVDEGGYSFPVLMVTDEGIEKIRNGFSEPETDRIFARPVRIDWSRAPTAYFPLDGESDDSEYAEQILPRVITQISSGASRIVVADLAREVIPMWQLADRQFKKRVEAKIITVLDYAERHDFSKFLRREKSYSARAGSPAWEIVDNPYISEPSRRMTHSRKMKGRQEKVLAHFRGTPVQRDLPLEIA